MGDIEDRGIPRWIRTCILPALTTIRMIISTAITITAIITIMIMEAAIPLQTIPLRGPIREAADQAAINKEAPLKGNQARQPVPVRGAFFLPASS